MDVTRHHTFSWSEITDAEIGKQAKLNYCMAFFCRPLAISLSEYITSHTFCTAQSRLFSLETREPKTQPRRCPRKRRVTNYPYYQKVNVHHTPCPRVQTPERQERRPGSARLNPREPVSLACDPKLMCPAELPSPRLPPKESRHLESYSFRTFAFAALRAFVPTSRKLRRVLSMRDTMVSVPFAYAKLSLLSTPMSSSSAKLWKCTGRCASL